MLSSGCAEATSICKVLCIHYHELMQLAAGPLTRKTLNPCSCMSGMSVRRGSDRSARSTRPSIKPGKPTSRTSQKSMDLEASGFFGLNGPFRLQVSLQVQLKADRSWGRGGLGAPGSSKLHSETPLGDRSIGLGPWGVRGPGARQERASVQAAGMS